MYYSLILSIVFYLYWKNIILLLVVVRFFFFFFFEGTISRKTEEKSSERVRIRVVANDPEYCKFNTRERPCLREIRIFKK